MKTIAIMSILGLSLFSFFSSHQAFARPREVSENCPRFQEDYQRCMQSDRANQKGDSCQAERNALRQGNCPQYQAACHEGAIGNMLFCSDHRTVYRHQVCRNGRMVMEDVNGGQANCPGQPAQQEQAHPQNCIDPDHSDINQVGGDMVIRSTTSGWLGSGRSRRYVTREDKCSRELDGDGNPRLTEYTCVNDTDIGLRTDNCPGGVTLCYNGTCQGRCTDSDNTGNRMGEDRFVKGLTQFYMRDPALRAWVNDTRTDACLSEHELTEYYCERNNIFINAKTYQCPANEICDDGKCVNTLPIELNSCKSTAWENGREYNLVQDLNVNTNWCFFLQGNRGSPARDIVFDCKGHQITCEDGTCDSAFYLSNANNITIKNCTVSHFAYGFNLRGLDGFTLLNNTANDNMYGFILRGEDGSGLNISNNQACNNSEDDFHCGAFSGDIQQGENNTFGQVVRCRRNQGWPFAGQYRPCP